MTNEIYSILKALLNLDISKLKSYDDEKLLIKELLKNKVSISIDELSEQLNGFSINDCLLFIDKFKLADNNPYYFLINSLNEIVEGKPLNELTLKPLYLPDFISELIEYLRINNHHQSDDYSLFWHAIIEDNTHLIEAFINSGEMNIHALNYYNENLLHIAAKLNSLNVFKLFCENQLDIDAVNSFGQTPLHLALYSNAFDVATFLLNSDCNISVGDELGNTPLHIACAKNTDFAIKLIKWGASVFAKNKSGDTPLDIALIFDNVDLVKYIIENKKVRKLSRFLLIITANDSVNCFNYLKQYNLNLNKRFKGLTPLHLSTIYNTYNIAKLYLENGASVNVRTKKGITPLHNSCAKKELEMTKLLLQFHADVNAKSKKKVTPVLNCIMDDNTDMIKLLISNGADVNSCFIDGYNLLHYATADNNLELSAFLIDNGIDINKVTKEGVSPLHNVTFLGNMALLRLLLAKGVKINVSSKKGITPLMNALYEKNYSIVNALIESGADVNVKMKEVGNPLLYAILSENPSLAIKLVKYGADVNSYLKGESVLYYALLIGKPNEKKQELVKLLIECGVKIKKSFKYGLTPLHIAIHNEYDDIAKYLILNNCFINKRDKDGFTPLIKAIELNKVDLVKLLLSKGAKVNIKGWSPLHEAVTVQNPEIIRLLLAHKANPNARSKNHLTPLIIAVEQKNQEIISLLSDFLGIDNI